MEKLLDHRDKTGLVRTYVEDLIVTDRRMMMEADPGSEFIIMMRPLGTEIYRIKRDEDPGRAVREVLNYHLTRGKRTQFEWFYVKKDEADRHDTVLFGKVTPVTEQEAISLLGFNAYEWGIYFEEDGRDAHVTSRTLEETGEIGWDVTLRYFEDDWRMWRTRETTWHLELQDAKELAVRWVNRDLDEEDHSA